MLTTIKINDTGLFVSGRRTIVELTIDTQDIFDNVANHWHFNAIKQIAETIAAQVTTERLVFELTTQLISETDRSDMTEDQLIPHKLTSTHRCPACGRTDKYESIHSYTDGYGKMFEEYNCSCGRTFVKPHPEGRKPNEPI